MDLFKYRVSQVVNTLIPCQIVLKLDRLFDYLLMFQKNAGWVANRVDPDHTLHSVGSDLSLYY